MGIFSCCVTFVIYWLNTYKISVLICVKSTHTQRGELIFNLLEIIFVYRYIHFCLFINE